MVYFVETYAVKLIVIIAVIIIYVSVKLYCKRFEFFDLVSIGKQCNL